MQSYQLVIDETQRQILVAALRGGRVHDYADIMRSGWSANIADDVSMLRQLFEALPEAEKETPRTLHGFCL